MPVAVRELTGSGVGIQTAGTDGVLIFPNVLTCIAVAAYGNGILAGAHVTELDHGNLARIHNDLSSTVGGTPTFHVAGPLDSYDLSLFINAQEMRTGSGVDICIRHTGNGIEMSSRPAGSAGELTLTGFRPVKRGCGGCCIMM